MRSKIKTRKVREIKDYDIGDRMKAKSIKVDEIKNEAQEITNMLKVKMYMNEKALGGII